MNKINLRIGFIGAGSIGSLFGGYLANNKSDNYSLEVIFFNREPHVDAVNKKGLKIYRNQEIKVIKNIRAYKDEKFFEDKIDHDSSFKFDFIFLTTKTYDIETVILQYKRIIDASKYLVILQNGIGNEEVLTNYCEESKLIRIVTSHGALLKKPGNVYHTGTGFTYAGFPFLALLKLNKEGYRDAQSNLTLLITLLNQAGIEASLVEDIIEKSWEKAFVNIGINALGALTRLRNGKLLENEALKKIMTGAVKEALKVAELKEIELSKRDFIELTYSVAEKTYNNKNSMLQDVLKGNKTEIDFMNGKIVEYAGELGFEVPINELLTNLVKGLEES